MTELPVKRIVEAALLAAAQPLTALQLTGLFEEQERIDLNHVAQALEELARDTAERGVELVEVASGFRFQVRADLQPWISRLWTERQSRYSRAMLETLALIAYRQPITRGEIEQIRGVAVSSQIIKTLEEREWVRVLGYRDVPGRPALLGTTRQFLDYFKLRSLDQLPPLAAVRDLESIDPQLSLGEPGARALAEAASGALGEARDHASAIPESVQEVPEADAEEMIPESTPATSTATDAPNPPEHDSTDPTEREGFSAIAGTKP